MIETWKRRILTFLRTQAVREIQELESTVEDLTERLEASRITVSQPSSSHNPPAVTILNTDDTLQPLEHSATLSATASSTSSGQGFTPVYNGTSRLSNVQYDDDNNLLWSRDRDPWFFEGASSSEQTPLPAVGRQAQDSNEKRKPPPEAKANCPICFDGMGSKDRVSRCHGCLEKFHESCINAWVKQCKEASTNATCPCWSVFFILTSLPKLMPEFSVAASTGMNENDKY